MPNFLIYDPHTGNILGAYSIPASMSGGPFLQANTPTGAESLEVAAGHDAIFHQAAWKIQSGQLVKIG